MASRAVLEYRDYNRQKQQTSFDSETLTAANFDTQQTAWSDLVSAIDAVTVGELSVDWYGNRTENTGVPTTGLAQVQNQWRFSFTVDAGPESGAVRTLRVGTADLTKLSANSDNLDLTAGDGATLKTAFEAFYRYIDSAATPQTVTLTSVVFVS